MFVVSWLVPILAWAPTAQMQAEKTVSVPVFFKLFLPVALIAFLIAMAAITILGVAQVLTKRVPLEEPEGGNIPPLGSGEMTKFESQSRYAPAFGKVMASIFIVALLTFMVGGMYSIGAGSSTTDQLRKEGLERQKAADKRQKDSLSSAGGGSEPVIGDDAPSRPRGGEFGTGLDGMEAMDGMDEGK